MSFAPAPAKSGNSIAEAMPFLESGMVLPLWTRSLRLGFKAKIGSIFSINKNRAGKPFSLPCAVFIWSEWRDLNSRPLDPQSSALPTAPHPVICFLQRILSYHRCPQKARLFIKKSAFYRFTYLSRQLAPYNRSFKDINLPMLPFTRIFPPKNARKGSSLRSSSLFRLSSEMMIRTS